MELPGAAAWQRSLKPGSSQDAAEPLPGYLTYIKYEVGLDRAIAVMRLLVPEFVEIRGCVLLRGVESYSTETFEQWWSTLKGDVAAIEDLLNRLPLWDLFADLTEDGVTDRALAELGSSIELTWKAALSKRFPNRRFLVEFRDETTGYGPTVSFHSLM